MRDFAAEPLRTPTPTTLCSARGPAEREHRATMIVVVAAVIEWNGKLLVCQRRRGETFGLMWEFPGGKLQAGETPAQGLARELREELGVDAEVGVELFRTRHRYGEMSEAIKLIFLAAKADASKIRNMVFERMEWRAPSTLPELNFLPADRKFITKLAREHIAATKATS